MLNTYDHSGRVEQLMTPQELANGLNNAQRGEEVSPAEEKLAKENRLVVVFVASDCIVKFLGAIDDEKLFSKSVILFIHPTGKILHEAHCCNCDYRNFAELQSTAKAVEVLWAAEPGYSWTYKTGIPHATFEVFDGAEPYCRGIVFSLDNVK